MIILGTAKYRAMQDSIAQMESLVHQVRAELASYRAPSKPIRMRFVAAGDDWITCKYWDGTAENLGDLVYVAKPFDNRKTGHTTGYTYAADGITRTHISSSEEQTYFPPYVVDDELHAQLVIGGTGVLDPDENPITLEEVTPRHWSYVCE